MKFEPCQQVLFPVHEIIFGLYFEPFDALYTVWYVLF